MLDRIPAMSSLCISKLQLQVHLGCEAWERAQRQDIHVTIEARFDEIPRGAATDRLEDTLCYANISKRVTEVCEAKPYHLIEKMGFEIYNLVRAQVGLQTLVGIRIHKLHPPVANLLGGSIFSCGDFQL